MAGAKVVYRREVRVLVPRKNSEANVLVRGSLDPPGRENADRVPVQKQRRHHPWRIRSLAASVLRLKGSLDSRQIELRDKIENEVGKVVGRQPLQRRRRSEERRVGKEGRARVWEES